MKKILHSSISIILVLVMMLTLTPITISSAAPPEGAGITMSDNEAVAFIGFIYNVSNVTDQMKTNGDLFKFLTGQLEKGSEEELVAKISFLYTMYMSVNKNANESDAKADISRTNLVNLLEKRVPSSGLGEDAYANSVLGQVKDSIAQTVATLFNVSDSEIESFKLACDTYSEIASLPSKINDFVDNVCIALNGFFYVYNANRAGMYKYYLTYIENRWLVDEDYGGWDFFRSIMDVNSYELQSAEMVNDPFLNWSGEDHITVLERWAEFSYSVEHSLNEEASTDDITNPDSVTLTDEEMSNDKYLLKAIDNNGSSKMLFDPELAEFSRKLSVDAYDVDESSSGNADKTFKEEGFEDIAFRHYTTHDDERWSSNYMLGVKPFEVNGQEKHILAIAFKGTDFSDEGLKDILVDMDFIGTDGFHTGFYAAAASAYLDCLTVNLPSLNMTVADYLAKSGLNNSDYQVVVTGHSLGGAIADIFTANYLDLSEASKSNTVAYTFGAPKSASSSKASSLNAWNIFNIVNTDDWVTTVGYMSSGSRIGNDINYNMTNIDRLTGGTINYLKLNGDLNDSYTYTGYGSAYNSGWTSSNYTNIINMPAVISITHGIDDTYKYILGRVSQNISTYYNCYKLMIANRPAEIQLTGNFTISNDTNFITYASLIRNSGTLTIDANSQVLIGGNMSLNSGGTLTLDGELVVQGDTVLNAGSMFGMTKPTSHFIAWGNVTGVLGSGYDNKPRSAWTDGLIEAKGDFNSTLKSCQNQTVCFNGNKEQKVNGVFGILENANTGGGITINEVAAEKVLALTTTPVNNGKYLYVSKELLGNVWYGDINVCGVVLDHDFTVVGNFCNYSILNWAIYAPANPPEGDFNVTVTNNVSNFTISNGTLSVTGNYDAASYGNGNFTISENARMVVNGSFAAHNVYCNGVLHIGQDLNLNSGARLDMTAQSSYVFVGGNINMPVDYYGGYAKGTWSDGLIEVRGDYNSNISSTQNQVVLFSGNKLQTVSGSGNFATLKSANTEGGIKFSNSNTTAQNVLALTSVPVINGQYLHVTNEILGTDWYGDINACGLTVSHDTTIYGKLWQWISTSSISKNLTITDSTLHVTGDYQHGYIGYGGTLSVSNTGKIIIDGTFTSGSPAISDIAGSMTVNGDAILASGTKLNMTSATSHIVVNGNFSTGNSSSSTATGTWSDGLLEVGGNYTSYISGTGNHTVRFIGSKLQIVAGTPAFAVLENANTLGGISFSNTATAATVHALTTTPVINGQNLYVTNSFLGDTWYGDVNVKGVTINNDFQIQGNLYQTQYNTTCNLTINEATLRVTGNYNGNYYGTLNIAPNGALYVDGNVVVSGSSSTTPFAVKLDGLLSAKGYVTITNVNTRLDMTASTSHLISSGNFTAGTSSSTAQGTWQNGLLEVGGNYFSNIPGSQNHVVRFIGSQAQSVTGTPTFAVLENANTQGGISFSSTTTAASVHALTTTPVINGSLLFLTNSFLGDTWYGDISVKGAIINNNFQIQGDLYQSQYNTVCNLTIDSATLSVTGNYSSNYLGTLNISPTGALCVDGNVVVSGSSSATPFTVKLDGLLSAKGYVTITNANTRLDMTESTSHLISFGNFTAGTSTSVAQGTWQDGLIEVGGNYFSNITGTQNHTVRFMGTTKQTITNQRFKNVEINNISTDGVDFRGSFSLLKFYKYYSTPSTLTLTEMYTSSGSVMGISGATWTSSNTDVATVSNGVITIKNPGTTIITANTSTQTGSCTIIVYSPLSSITLNKTATTLNKGQTESLSVLYDPVDTTDDTTVAWSTSDSNIVTVENGVITANNPGTATITAKVGNKEAFCIVTVLSPLIAISLNETTTTLNKGQTASLTVIYNPTDTTDDKTTTWSSSDSNIASVTNGIITAINPGTATITATVGTKQATCVVTVTSSFAVTFNVINGNGTLIATMDSTGISSGTSVEQDKNIVFTATPDSGYRVKEWKDNGATVNGTNTSYTVSGIAAAHAVTVEFELIPPTTYTVTVGTLTNGKITTFPTTATAGTTITLTVTPDSGYRLKAGTLKYNGTAISGTTFIMPAANVIVTAEFELIPPTTYTVTVGTLTNGKITASPTTATAGTTVILTVTPDGGYQLKAGTLKYNSTAISGTTFTMPAANVTVTAEFELIPATTYTITATAGAGGSVSGGGTYAQGANVNLTATADTGYVFDGWYENNVKIEDTGAVYLFTATANRTLEARFITAAFDQSFLGGEVRIQAGAGIVPSGAVFNVIKVVPPPDEAVQKVKDQISPAAIIISYYEITLEGSDGDLITQLAGDLTISIKLPDGYTDGTGLQIYQEASDGTLVKMESWIQNGYICYKTNWLETYNS